MGGSEWARHWAVPTSGVRTSATAVYYFRLDCDSSAMSGYAGGHYEEGYGHPQGDAYYGDEHGQAYYDHNDYGDGYYDAGYGPDHT
ncbi:1-3-beta-glucan synthase component GLS2 [Penicillium lagena]|uniref:1-3-beta-glucan synthase component GLS2 n=1 Tax=Penicillium lagena TaxID=94218 RepID=UPI002540031D|nr:1-3-beta-glucan synthase component GLS2 [Penicillium lagena]KAJ5606420.1 1-3-beta-glucan synthase component GLS2 [Penicillium lagena]